MIKSTFSCAFLVIKWTLINRIFLKSTDTIRQCFFRCGGYSHSICAPYLVPTSSSLSRHSSSCHQFSSPPSTFPSLASYSRSIPRSIPNHSIIQESERRSVQLGVLQRHYQFRIFFSHFSCRF